MFKQIAEEHSKTKKEKQKQLKDLETKIVDTSLPAFSQEIFKDLNTESEQIVQNQKDLEKKCKQVRDGWEKFNNELGKWSSLVIDFDKAIRDIGDIQSWAMKIQQQVDDACEKLESKK